MSPATPASPASALVEVWLAAGPLPASAAPSDLAAACTQLGSVALAWALKDACQAAWANDPARSRQAASLSQHLARHTPDPAVQALAAWAAGMGALADSQLAEATAQLQASVRAWQALGQPLPAAQASVAMLMPLALQGRFDDALRTGEEAEQALTSHGDLQGAAKVALNLGSLALHRDRYTEATAHYQRAAVRFARLDNREHSVMADIGQADALAYAGRTEDATLLYERAAMRAGQHGLPMLAAQAGHGSALLALGRGRYREALAGLVRAQRDFQHLQAEHYQSEVERDLADAYLELRLLPEALALYDALAARLQAHGNAATLPWLLLQRARAQALAGQRGAALAGLAQASQQFQQEDNPTGAHLAALASLELQLRDSAPGGTSAAPATDTPADTLPPALDTPALLALAQRAQALASALPAATAPRALLLQARAWRRAGQAGWALPVLAPLCHPDTAHSQPQVHAAAWGEAALLHRARGDDTAAAAACETAIGAFEELRAALPGSDFQLALLGEHLQPFRLRLALALAHEGPPEVLAWLDRQRARVLAERLGRGTDGAAATLDASTREQLAPLRERLNWIRRKHQRLTEDGDDGLPPPLRDEALHIERQLLETTRRARTLQAGQAGPGAAGRAAAALSVPDLQARFRDGQALVQYGVVGDELLALVVAQGQVRLLRSLAPWGALQQALQRLRFQLDSLRAGARLAAHQAQLLQRSQAHLQALHRQLWAPLLPALAGADEVVVVPCDALHTLPFAALHDGQHWLGERCRLRLAASATLALHRPPSAPARTDPGAALRLLVGESGQLPQVRAELQAVAAALTSGGDGAMTGAVAKGPARPSRPPQVLLDDQAGVQATLAQLPEAEVLHLACHAEFRTDSPAHSALHLADGLLTAAQIEEQQLSARLVVLSACHTGSAHAAPGDEGIGLVRAFLLAGAHEVVASLWAVDDEATALLMTHFYQHWCGNGQHAAPALQQAQHDLRQTHPHPYHWAAFVLHGRSGD